jgi:hypothetical protein
MSIDRKIPPTSPRPTQMVGDSMSTFNLQALGKSLSTANLQSLGTHLGGSKPATPTVQPLPATSSQVAEKPSK